MTWDDMGMGLDGMGKDGWQLEEGWRGVAWHEPGGSWSREGRDGR